MPDRVQEERATEQLNEGEEPDPYDDAYYARLDAEADAAEAAVADQLAYFAYLLRL